MPIDRERWIALGLLLGALLLAYALLIHSWWTVPILEANERIADLQQRDQRLRAQQAQEPQVRKRLDEVRVRQTTEPGFLSEPSAELATAGLVQRLEAVVAQASPGNRSCAITNRSPLTEPSREQFARVVVQVRLRCGAKEAAAVLYALESGAPRLFVDNLNMLAQRYFFSGGDNSNDSGRDGGLDVSFDLYGYLRPAPDANAAAGEPAGNDDAASSDESKQEAADAT